MRSGSRGLAQELEWKKGPEERQGKVGEKRTPLRDNYCEGKQPIEAKKVRRPNLRAPPDSPRVIHKSGSSIND